MTQTHPEVTPAEAQEIEASGHYVAAELCGKALEVVPSGAWKQSTMRMLRSGDIDAFMERVLSPDSYDLYLDLDPSNDEVGAFVADAGEASGEPVGKSSGPTASSRRTRKR
ncbi:hypothetical protein [Streptomyces sp. NPDC096339]|uniref:hypothetical protein n=1 Tax=Streptomyces sp. NPDC096339 TaxID=3366086 RepID=UPI00381ABF75